MATYVKLISMPKVQTPAFRRADFITAIAERVQ